MNYEVRLKQYSGPLDKLLSLIEERQLEITQLSLSAVTEDFIKYVQSLENKAEAPILSDFVVVAAKLLLIKSKALLPDLELTRDEKVDAQDLERRLHIYREFKRAAQHIKQIWYDRPVVFGREFLSAFEKQGIFYPPPEINDEKLHASLAKLLTVLKELLPETAQVKQTIIKLEDKIQELLNRFQQTAVESFHRLTKEKARVEIIVFFLAVLHLLKDKMIEVEQQQQFGEIKLKKT